MLLMIVARMPLTASCPPMMVGCSPLLLVDGLPLLTVDEPSLIGYCCWLSKGCRWLATVAWLSMG